MEKYQEQFNSTCPPWEAREKKPSQFFYSLNNICYQNMSKITNKKNTHHKQISVLKIHVKFLNKTSKTLKESHTGIIPEMI